MRIAWSIADIPACFSASSNLYALSGIADEAAVARERRSALVVTACRCVAAICSSMATVHDAFNDPKQEIAGCTT